MLSATVPSLQDSDTSRPVASHVRYRGVPGPTFACSPSFVVTMPSVPKRRLGSNAMPRAFELTGQVTPIHSPALVDLVGRVPRAPPEIANEAPSPRRPCRGLGATCHLGRQGGRHGCRSPLIRRDTARCRSATRTSFARTHGSARRRRSRRMPAPGRSSAKTFGADPSHLALLTGLDGRPGAGACPPAPPQARIPTGSALDDESEEVVPTVRGGRRKIGSFEGVVSGELTPRWCGGGCQCQKR